MMSHFKNFWEELKEDSRWYRPSWANLYHSKAVHDFIWRSDEDFGDANIRILKQKIKRIIWEFVAYILIIICSIIGIILHDIYK
jgi:hypothetical protein